MAASHPLQKRVTVDGCVDRGGGSFRKLLRNLFREFLSFIRVRILTHLTSLGIKSKTSRYKQVADESISARHDLMIFGRLPNYIILYVQRTDMTRSLPSNRNN